MTRSELFGKKNCASGRPGHHAPFLETSGNSGRLGRSVSDYHTPACLSYVGLHVAWPQRWRLSGRRLHDLRFIDKLFIEPLPSTVSRLPSWTVKAFSIREPFVSSQAPAKGWVGQWRYGLQEGFPPDPYWC